MNEEKKICLIAPTEELASRARKMVELQNLPILVYTEYLDGAVKLAEKLLQQGVWLFISRRGTRLLLEKELKLSVVNIPMHASDYIPAIQKVQDKKGLVAFFSFEEKNDELETICFLLNIKMHQYCFTDTKSCGKCVEQAVQDGALWGIGGVVAQEYAEKAGLSFLPIESSDESIRQALESAIQIYELQKKNLIEQEKLEIQLERYRNILNYTHDAIIAVDQTGRIEVTNKVAERIMNQSKRPFEGKLIEDVLPNTHIREVIKSKKAETDQLMKIQNVTVATNRIPIMVNNEIKGVVATFQDVHSLQNAERSIRIKMHDKGLIAKYTFDDIIGESPKLKDSIQLAKSFANSEFTIMLYGETGTGKEMFAQSIHKASSRKDGPFVAVNCMALSKSLLEAELFGYADSSFTGAKKGGKPGLFELAHGGTIFLDEIGELPLEFQPQFLRVLQEKEVRRIGGDNVIPVDIRIICATNKDLFQKIEDGTFRQDLYYRINVLTVALPPLRERENDYLLIADRIHEKLSPYRTAEETSKLWNVLEHFQKYHWHGNVRELNNFVERICLLISQKYSVDDICNLLSTMNDGSRFPVHSEKESIPQIDSGSLNELEKELIEHTLEETNGNISITSQKLNISRSTLYRKIRKYSIMI